MEGLSWSPDGKRLAVGQYDLNKVDAQLEIQEWSFDSQEPTLLFSLLVSRDTSVAWQLLGDDGYVLLPNENGDRFELDTLGANTIGQTHAVFAVSPDGTRSVNRDRNTLGVKDVASNEFLYTLRFLPVSATAELSAIFTSNGRTIVGYGPHMQVHIWDAATGDLVTALNVFSNAMAFSPDGRWMATGKGTQVALWDLSAILPPALID